MDVFCIMARNPVAVLSGLRSDIARLNVFRTRTKEFLCLGNNFLIDCTQDFPKIAYFSWTALRI